MSEINHGTRLVSELACRKCLGLRRNIPDADEEVEKGKKEEKWEVD